MNLTDADKRYILNELFSSISHFTDEEYQRRVWIRGEGPEGQDYDEAVCSFFDIGDPVLEDYKNFGITDNQYQILKTFRDAFEKFSDENYSPEEFLSNAEWKKIMEMAKEVLVAFNYQKKTEGK